MTVVRRHDLYVLRAFLAAFGAVLLVLTSLVVVFDLADRIGKLPTAFEKGQAQGLTPAAALVEYYGTYVPFLWLEILPVSVLIAAGLSVTWLARQNEIAPLVTAGVPSRRVLLPVLLATVAVAGLESLARETVVPPLSRRHDDLHRLLFERRGRLGRFQDVPHMDDLGGGRLSMSAYVPAERVMEAVWITFRTDPAAGGERTAYRYPLLSWDEAGRRWTAPHGGERHVLGLQDTGTSVKDLGPADPVPLRLRPSLIELQMRRGAAMGMSSGEIAALSRAYPGRTRFRLLLHEQAAASVATVVLLLLGLPLVFRLGRRSTLAAFGRAVAASAAFFLAGAVASDLGGRGTLNPVVAAWGSDVVFGALGLVLWAGMET